MNNDTSVISLFARASHQSLSFHDLIGDAKAFLTGPATMIIKTELRSGLYEMRLATMPGSFETDTLMLQLKEWPTLRTVAAGPFDFDHTEYRMVVPTFRVFVDGRDQGLVWCEVPSPMDMAARRIRASWGILIEQKGAHEIRLEIPDGETRLKWHDMASLEISPDDRYALPVAGVSSLERARPRLFAFAAEFDALSTTRDKVQQAILDKLEHRLATGVDGTYEERTATAAFVGRLTGNRRWIREAIDRTMELCRRPYWGYHDVPEIMGWNNDRDTGVRMFETAVTYDWLHHVLTGAQRKKIAGALAYYADLADRVTHLQRSYWYTRTCEAHGQGYWFGFACAALALLGDDSRAGKWLEWIHGNMADALAHMPDDGITEWSVFNAQWLMLTTMLLERAMDRRIRCMAPFLQNFPRNILKLFRLRAVSVEDAGNVALLLFFLARRHRDRISQADALQTGGFCRSPEGATAVNSPLALLAYDPDLPPSVTSKPVKAFCSQNGTIVLGSEAKRGILSFRCGSPLGRRHWRKHTWLAKAWYRPRHAGSFEWRANGKILIPFVVPGYRERTRDANVITVNGAGHRLDARYLGGDMDIREMARMERFRHTGEITFGHFNLSSAYDEASHLRLLTRGWVFFHEAALLVMRDVIVAEKPGQFAWHAHTEGKWKKLAPLAYAAESDGESVAVRCLVSEARGAGRRAGGNQRITAVVSPTCYVPSYAYGLNSYKTLAWQPEIHAQMNKPPDFEELTYAPRGRATHWEAVTIMGPDVDQILSARRTDEDGVTVVSAGRVGCVKWRKGADPLRVVGLAADVEAEMVVLDGTDESPKRWIFQDARSWRKGKARECLKEPADLVWHPGSDAPRAL